MFSARNRELLGLVPAGLLVTAGFAVIFIQSDNRLSTVSLTYGEVFLALVPRRPHRDPSGATTPTPTCSRSPRRLSERGDRDRSYRISPSLARNQAQWLIVGLVLFAITIVVYRDGRYLKLEEYRYLIAIVGVGTLLLPRLPGIGGQVNGAYLAVHVGPISFQPSELGKIAIVIFLASYLRDNRQVLVTAGRRILWVTIPPMKQFGPLLLVWGLRHGDAPGDARDRHVADVLRRLPGAPLRRDRAVLVPLCRFDPVRARRLLPGHPPAGHIHQRVLAWEHPFSTQLYPTSNFQLANGLFAQADGGLLGVGFDKSLLGPLLPVAESDSIYAVITNEVGLVGAIALLLTYLLFVARGLKIATLARDSFSKLLRDRSRLHHRDAGLRHRRGRDGGDSADRRDAPVRGLRWIVGRHELRAARAVAARVRPGTTTGLIEHAASAGLSPAPTAEALDRRRDGAKPPAASRSGGAGVRGVAHRQSGHGCGSDSGQFLVEGAQLRHEDVHRAAAGRRTLTAPAGEDQGLGSDEVAMAFVEREATIRIGHAVLVLDQHEDDAACGLRALAGDDQAGDGDLCAVPEPLERGAGSDPAQTRTQDRQCMIVQRDAAGRIVGEQRLPAAQLAQRRGSGPASKASASWVPPGTLRPGVATPRSHSARRRSRPGGHGPASASTGPRPGELLE